VEESLKTSDGPHHCHWLLPSVEVEKYYRLVIERRIAETLENCLIT